VHADKTRHQMPVMRDRFRPADQIALNLTPFPRKECPLLLGLDALRDDRQRERAPKPQNGVDDGAGLKAVADPGDEGLVDLDLVEWKVLQVGQR
jgi:hypothetical protein